MRTIDTRDLIEERDDLELTLVDSFNDDFPQYEVEKFEEILLNEEEIQSWVEYFQDDIDRLEELNKVLEEVYDSQYGVTLIHEDDFDDYARELVEECGYITRDFPSWIEIDWLATADNVKLDYSSIEFEGETYLYRS